MDEPVPKVVQRGEPIHFLHDSEEIERLNVSGRETSAIEDITSTSVPTRSGAAARACRSGRPVCCRQPDPRSTSLTFEARNDPHEVIADPHARYFGTELSERSLIPGADARLGEPRLQESLNQRCSSAGNE
jgi:hypothetical protein